MNLIFDDIFSEYVRVWLPHIDQHLCLWLYFLSKKCRPNVRRSVPSEILHQSQRSERILLLFEVRMHSGEFALINPKLKRCFDRNKKISEPKQKWYMSFLTTGSCEVVYFKLMYGREIGYFKFHEAGLLLPVQATSRIFEIPERRASRKL